MRTDDKRKETSRLNALKSTGPKTPEGKRRSAFNAVTHAAYVQELILPGEELPQFQLILDAHLDNWKPTNPIEDTFVFEMASTLWRLRRQAPAESALIGIQIQRMSREILKDFATASPSAIYALAVVALQEHGDALNQISRQGRRLLSQYEKLTQQLLNMRQLFPPFAPEPPNLQSQPDLDSQNEPVETNLTEDQQTETQPAENGMVETNLLEKQPVETKLTGSVNHISLPHETRVLNHHCTLYVALPPISKPVEHVLNTEAETPAKTYKAGRW